ncbi:MAG: helix-turn-helix domain-containing protein [Microbacterium gubbeenense]|uniref:Helix-turn-helix transcriptional regulator n=1 Tax=Candidatus Microbacterium stercoravium TaxID=2838697 RepID=A0A9D2H400_9MICO|nr:helix-turn-helix transcriptional regulator [Candidatus Microbacterium stercoravium]
MARTPQPRLAYRWHLRRLMAEQEMFATTTLVPLLAERGVVLSEAQVYRLVTGTPERLSLRTLTALCDILGCTPNDLIEPVAETAATRATGTSGKPTTVPTQAKARTPRRAEITRGK